MSRKLHPNGLTLKGQQAVEHYLVHGDQAAAYEAAFGRGRCKPRVFDAAVRRFFGRPPVVAEVQRRQAELSARTDITREMVLRRLYDFGWTDLPGIADFDGHTLTVEQFRNLTPAQRAAIKEFEFEREPAVLVKDDEGNVLSTVEGKAKIKIKLEDRRAAVVDAGKAIGMWAKAPKQAILDKPIIVFQGMPT